MTRTFEELAKMDLADFVRALDNMSLEDLKANEGAILDAIDKTEYDKAYDDFDIAEEYGSDVYIECDDEDDDFDIAKEYDEIGEDDYDPCEDPDLFRESLLNQW